MKLKTISDKILSNQLLGALPVPVYTCDADGYIQLFNEAAAELWGRKPVAGKDLWCGSWKIYRLDGSELPLDECPMARALKEGRVISGEEIIIERPDGERRHIMPFPQPIFEESGQIAGAVNMLLDLTESKRSEKNMAHLAAIIQSTDDAIISKTLEGIVTTWNPAAEKLFGYTAKEMIGQSITTLIPHDRLSEETYIINRIKEGKLVDHFQTVRQTKNRGLVNISLTISPIKNANGEIIGASKIARDITLFKQADENTARLAAIVRFSDDAIISKTLDGIISSWNPAAERMFGFSADEMVGQPIKKLIPDDRLEEEDFILGRLRNGELVDHFRTLRKTKHRGLIDVSLTISPIKDNTGNIIGASKIARDVTREKLEEERLRENEKNLNQLANAMPQLVWITDANGKTTYINDRIAEYKGNETPATHWNWRELVHPDDFKSTFEDWRHHLEKGSSYVKEHRLRMNDEQYRWHLTRVVPFHNSSDVIIKWIGTSTDIDDMKKVALRKDDFLSVASHELRTPITAMKAYSQLLTETYRHSNDTFLKNALAKLEVQANKMTKLVNDFLKLSKIESGKLQLDREKFSITNLVNEIADEIQFVSINHKITVQWHQEVNVYADRERISQVIANFLNNAIKYSPGADEVRVIVELEGQEAKISVKDKGIGIGPEDHKKIFERFYRAKSTGNTTFSGFGIGLYISSEIIRRHNGKIGVESEEGKGSTFYFTLPIAE